MSLAILGAGQTALSPDHPEPVCPRHGRATMRLAILGAGQTALSLHVLGIDRPR